MKRERRGWFWIKTRIGEGLIFRVKGKRNLGRMQSRGEMEGEVRAEAKPGG